MISIGFDGKRATNNLTGLGNYSRSLISGLIEHFPQNQYFLYTPKIKDHPQIARFLNANGLTVVNPPSAGPMWRLLRLKKNLVSDGVSVFHGLSHELPIGLNKVGIASVVTIHDLIFLKFPQYFNTVDRWIYTWKCRYACRNADRIVAISESTKRDIVSHFNVRPEKIDVVYQSCDDSFKRVSTDESKQNALRKYRLPKQFILCVGTIEERKNLKILIKALPLVEPPIKLVVIGRQTVYYKDVLKEIELLGLQDSVLFLQDVSFADLPSIYQLAELFVYPSLYEGFGIPIIEALFSGIPVIAAKGSCLEEAGGPDSIYVDPRDEKALSLAINNVLRSAELRKEMSSKGLDFAQRFNNQIIANDLMNIYAIAAAKYKHQSHVKI
ncbi:glycosyltransferase family 4 protein [Pedobacter faecalis]|uniref:glycosyltransferase family 4 protein n=1 Tax=Pedobacter faecalis TaxID=3041495 RepID=UPI003305A189